MISRDLSINNKGVADNLAESPKWSWTLFTSVFLCCLAIHTNARDFPFPQVPIIYCTIPVFLFVILLKDRQYISDALRSIYIPALFISLLWIIKQALWIFNPYASSGPSFFYIIEPILLLAFGAVVCQLKDGIRIFIFSFIGAILFGTIWCFGSIYIGGFFQEIDILIHHNFFSYAGEDDAGTILQNMVLRYRNAGLTGSIFSYSYQNVAATTLSLSIIFGRNSNKRMNLLLFASVILLMGLISNAERSAPIALAIAIIAGLYFRNEVLRIKKTIAYGLLIAVICAGLIIFVDKPMQESGHDTLITRMLHGNESMSEDRRFELAWIATMSAFYHPIGNGEMSDYYVNNASYMGLSNASLGSHGLSVPASHNHFANQIMYVGLPGLILILSFFIFIASILLKVRRLSHIDIWGAILGAALVGVTLNSFAHNSGIFTAEPCSCLLLGALCSWHYLLKGRSGKCPNLSVSN